MELEGISVRRSQRLQRETPTNIEPQSPAESVEEQITYQLHELPDLGPGVETIPLSTTDIEFNGDYLPSQERTPRGYYSDSDEGYEEGSDQEPEIEHGGGLEHILWPPEVLAQARSYGARRGKKRNGDSNRDFEDEYESLRAIRAIERLGGAGSSAEGGLGALQDVQFTVHDSNLARAEAAWRGGVHNVFVHASAGEPGWSQRAAASSAVSSEPAWLTQALGSPQLAGLTPAQQPATALHQPMAGRASPVGQGEPEWAATFGWAAAVTQCPAVGGRGPEDGGRGPEDGGQGPEDGGRGCVPTAGGDVDNGGR